MKGAFVTYNRQQSQCLGLGGPAVRRVCWLDHCVPLSAFLSRSALVVEIGIGEKITITISILINDSVLYRFSFGGKRATNRSISINFV